MDAMAKRLLRDLLGGALVAGSLFACTPPGGPAHQPEPPISDAPSPATGPGASPREASRSSSGEVGVGPRALPPDPLLPTVDVEDASGKTSKAPDAAFTPLRERMKECTAGRPGVVRVRIKSDKGNTAMDIEPGSSLDGATHRCVLEQLSTVELDDMLSRGSPPDRPASGFSPVLRVEW